MVIKQIMIKLPQTNVFVALHSIKGTTWTLKDITDQNGTHFHLSTRHNITLCWTTVVPEAFLSD